VLDLGIEHFDSGSGVRRRIADRGSRRIEIEGNSIFYAHPAEYSGLRLKENLVDKVS
jgi:hypothetical protein